MNNRQFETKTLCSTSSSDGKTDIISSARGPVQVKDLKRTETIRMIREIPATAPSSFSNDQPADRNYKLTGWDNKWDCESKPHTRARQVVPWCRSSRAWSPTPSWTWPSRSSPANKTQNPKSHQCNKPRRRAHGDRVAWGTPTSTKPPHPWISSEAAAAEKKASRRERRTGKRRGSIDRSDLAGAEHATGRRRRDRGAEPRRR